MGIVVGDTAVVGITSGRDGSMFLARIERAGNRVIWKVVERLKDGGGPDSPLVPFFASLVPEKSEDIQRVSKDCAEVLKKEP